MTDYEQVVNMNQENVLCFDALSRAVIESDHPGPPPEDMFKPTSVMALMEFDLSPNLIFIQKADVKGYPWRNQMAFPGGHVDKKDNSPKAAALRELEEEVGIIAGNVSVMGSLGHFQTLRNKDIQAFTGVWNQKDRIAHDREEISRVFQIPFAHLARVHREKGYANRRPGMMELTYPFEDVVIWGVTAKIVHHLIEVVGSTD